MSIEKTKFGVTRNNQEVFLFTLRNKNGMTVKITNYGAIITAIELPGQNGKPENIVMGFDTLEAYTNKTYLNNCPFFVSLLGRYANRIKNGEFYINRKKYKVTQNLGQHHLHGGAYGFDKVVWEPMKTVSMKGQDILQLGYYSYDGEEGFPGNVQVYTVYQLLDDNSLFFIVKAKADRPTHLNVTQHTYFNLNGMKSKIWDHRVMINSNDITETDKDLIPTGTLQGVIEADMNFRSMQSLKKFRDKPDFMGFDHNFVLQPDPYKHYFAAIVEDPESGRKMKLLTNQPGLQFYTANGLDGSYTGTQGQAYHPYDALCLEPQGFPDTPNNTHFPPITFLRPNKLYHHQTEYRFEF